MKRPNSKIEEMKRGTRRVEFIEKQKQRALSFMKRRSGLVKQVRELSVLCGLDACMIINAPKEIMNNDFVWSSSSDTCVTVQDLIRKYKEQSVEESKRIKVYNVPKYYDDRRRKLEKMLAGLKKKKVEAIKLLTWNSKLDSMEEHELRDLADGLEVKIDDLKSRRELMKSKRSKTVISSSPSSEVLDQQVWSNGVNDLQPVYMTEHCYMNPMAMNSLQYNNNNNSRARYQMKMAMNLIDHESNCYVQPISMIKPGVNQVMSTFDHCAPQDSQPQFVNDLKRFGNYNSGEQTGANVFCSSFVMDPATMSTDVPKSSVYDHNAFNFTVFDCSPMQLAHAFRNSQMEHCVPSQSFLDLPPLPPLMLEYSTNQHVSSQMQYSEQHGRLYNFQTDRHTSWFMN